MEEEMEKRTKMKYVTQERPAAYRRFMDLIEVMQLINTFHTFRLGRHALSMAPDMSDKSVELIY